MSWIGAALAIASKTLDLILGWQRKSERGEYREAGVQAQQNADMKETIRAKDDQLKKAADARPGDARKRLRDKSF